LPDIDVMRATREQTLHDSVALGLVGGGDV
jgi:hypothetical protein